MIDLQNYIDKLVVLRPHKLYYVYGNVLLWSHHAVNFNLSLLFFMFFLMFCTKNECKIKMFKMNKKEKNPYLYCLMTCLHFLNRNVFIKYCIETVV